LRNKFHKTDHVVQLDFLWRLLFGKIAVVATCPIPLYSIALIAVCGWETVQMDCRLDVFPYRFHGLLCLRKTQSNKKSIKSIYVGKINFHFFYFFKSDIELG
jgi:hypothetical protein